MIECIRALSLPQGAHVSWPTSSLCFFLFYYLTDNMHWFVLAAQQHDIDCITVELGLCPCCRCSSSQMPKVGGYLRVGSSSGLSHDVGMVDISMVFQVFLRVKCTQSGLDMCNTFSLSNDHLTWFSYYHERFPRQPFSQQFFQILMPGF